MKKTCLFAISVGIAAGVVLAGIFTVWNWLENPGGIFRDDSGTHWSFVYDTAASWFFPTLVYVTVIAAIGHLGYSALRAVYRKRNSRNDG